MISKKTALKIYNIIKDNPKIIIHRHDRPDGDALGSQMGLKQAILATFPTHDVKIVGDINKRYFWMGEMDTVLDEEYENTLVFVLDTGALKLISDDRYNTGKMLVKIDHHIPQDTYGDFALEDTSYESCCGLIADIIFKSGMKLNDAGANALFTGMVTDSGRFRYSSTSSNTYVVASELAKYNLNTDYIYSNLYVEKLENVKLKAELITKFKVTEKGVAYLINTQEEIKKYNVSIFDISRGMVNIMAGIENIPIWANFSEDEDGSIYVELRSSGININTVAVAHGGGGHHQASGCTVKTFEEVYQIIDELNNLIS